MTIADSYTSFVVKNYENILALNQLVDHAKTTLPDIIDKMIQDAIIGIDDKIFAKSTFYLESKNDDFWWTDLRLYNIHKYTGAYISYSENFKKLFESISLDPDDSLYLYLGVDTESLSTKPAKNKYIDQYKKVINKLENKKRLNKAMVIVNEYADHKDDELLKFMLNKEINIKTILNENQFNKNLQEAVCKFTSLVFEILLNAKIRNN